MVSCRDSREEKAKLCATAAGTNDNLTATWPFQRTVICRAEKIVSLVTDGGIPAPSPKADGECRENGVQRPINTVVSPAVTNRLPNRPHEIS